MNKTNAFSVVDTVLIILLTVTCKRISTSAQPKANYLQKQTQCKHNTFLQASHLDLPNSQESYNWFRNNHLAQPMCYCRFSVGSMHSLSSVFLSLRSFSSLFFINAITYSILIYWQSLYSFFEKLHMRLTQKLLTKLTFVIANINLLNSLQRTGMGDRLKKHLFF